MHYCNDCGHFGAAVYSEETYTNVCARCHSEDIEPAGECRICGIPVKSSEDYCEDCLTMGGRYVLELAVEMETTTEKARNLLLAVMEKEDESGFKKI